MTIRIRFWQLVSLGVPLILVLGSLAVHDHYWVPTGRTHVRPGALLLVVTGVLFGTFVGSYVPHLRDSLSRPFRHRWQYVQSSPAQAAVAIWLVRGVCVVVLWGVGMIGIQGRFIPG